MSYSFLRDNLSKIKSQWTAKTLANLHFLLVNLFWDESYSKLHIWSILPVFSCIIFQ